MIVVLGCNGMLGSMILEYGTRKSCNIIGLGRKEFDVLKDNILKILNYIPNKDNVTIINCIGAIPQKKYKNIEFIILNSLFSHNLSELCKSRNFKLIHISTNCVFEGNKFRFFNEDDEPNNENIYGKTKALGEPKYGLTIRCSIIGPEIEGQYGLFDWFRNSEDQILPGYIDSYWNGVTTLELSKIIFEMLKDDNIMNDNKKIHVYSENIVSKYELLRIFNEIFYNGKKIIPTYNGGNNKTCLLTSKIMKPCKNIKEQIIELKTFLKKND